MNRHVLITGGNRGIGAETTRMFLDAGYQVTVVARDFTDFVLKDHRDVRCVEYDLRDIDGIADMIASLDPVHTLINNAGVMYSLPWDSYPEEKKRSIMQVNIEARLP